MNRIFMIFLIGLVTIGLVTLSAISDQFVDAGSTKKVHFTKTITSSQDPGIGHESHQLAMILSPNQGTIYDGSVTFSSSEPVQVTVLHEINPSDSKGQPTWSIGGNTIYGLSLIDSELKSGSVEFTGAALALHSSQSKEFTATVSVDGWIRGQPTEIVMQKIELEKDEPSVLLSRLNVPTTIPMHKGLYENKTIFYIITDSSDNENAKKLSDIQDWKVKTATALSNVENSTQKIFVFTNGIKGDGIDGFQEEVFTSIPSKSDYTALSSMVEVTWKKGQKVVPFKSANDILEAHKGGRVEFNETGIVLNTPHIVWPDGEIKVRQEKTVTDQISFEGGQIISIDKETMKVTFIAHRGWGSDGSTTYCIVADATPLISAEMMGVVHSSSHLTMESNSTMDVFHFKNGIKGTGPLGFQPGITSAPSDQYSPIMRTYLVEWNDPKSAKILESQSDVDYFLQNEKITVSLAQLANSEHIVNCPIIDPFQ